MSTIKSGEDSTCRDINIRNLTDPAKLFYFPISVLSYLPASAWQASTRKKTRAAIKADIGMVRIQAQTTDLATPQRTAETRRVAPTPTIAPVIV